MGQSCGVHVDAIRQEHLGVFNVRFSKCHMGCQNVERGGEESRSDLQARFTD